MKLKKKIRNFFYTFQSIFTLVLLAGFSAVNPVARRLHKIKIILRSSFANFVIRLSYENLLKLNEIGTAFYVHLYLFQTQSDRVLIIFLYNNFFLISIFRFHNENDYR